MRAWQSRPFIFVVGFALGLLASWVWGFFSFWSSPVKLAWNVFQSGTPFSQQHQWSLQNPSQPSADDSADSTDSNQSDPFAQMQKMREQMMQQLQNNQLGREDELEAGSGIEMQTRDVQEGGRTFSVVTIRIPGLQEKNLNVEVKDARILVSGTVRQKTAAMEVQHSFSQVFPVPDGVDAKAVEISPEPDQLLLKFPHVDTH